MFGCGWNVCDTAVEQHYLLYSIAKTYGISILNLNGPMQLDFTVVSSRTFEGNSQFYQP